MKLSLSLVICLLAIHSSIYSQNQHLIDSLLRDLQRLNNERKVSGARDTTLRDTFIIKNLEKLASLYNRVNPDSGRYYANLLLVWSSKLDNKKALSAGFNILGSVSKKQGNYSEAIDYYQQAIELRKALNDSLRLGETYANLGEVYRLKANYPEALKFFLLSLRIDEAIHYETGIAYAYNYMGATYQELGDNAKALENFKAALEIRLRLGQDAGIAIGYNNIGTIYDKEGKYAEALENFNASLAIKEKIGDKYGMANTYINIGEVYKAQGDHQGAMKYLNLALKLQEELEDQEGIAATYISMSGSRIATRQYEEASLLLTKAVSISKEIGSLYNLRQSYSTLVYLDSITGNSKQGLQHYKLYVAARDSISNEENTRKLVETQMQYDFDKKESLAKVEQDKKDFIAQKILQKQKMVRNGFMAGFAVVLLFAGIFLTQRNKIKQGKKRSDELLLNILPAEVAEELKAKGSAEAKHLDLVTVLFTDIIGFTEISARMSAGDLVNDINACFSGFDRIIQDYGIEKIKTIGDSYMAAGGLPTPNTTHAVDVVNAALAMQRFVMEQQEIRRAKGQTFFEIRLGVHTGPVVAGIVGVKKFQYDIWGDTVNTASRIESAGQSGMVNISHTTYEYVKDKFTCIPRGHIHIKGKGEVEMYFVEGM
ncbi:MAG: tetratricopeptide repeat protein [Saprospiraceae bacterium]|nr:tetratricopeptide repeat protein [Saprospiraceae bacterium]